MHFIGHLVTLFFFRRAYSYKKKIVSASEISLSHFQSVISSFTIFADEKARGVNYADVTFHLNLAAVSSPHLFNNWLLIINT